MPALLIKMSTGPASAASRRTSSALLRSAATKRALPPEFSISRTTLAPRSALRPWTTTSAPRWASCSAISRPIPDVATVTSAVEPASVLAIESCLQERNSPTPPRAHARRHLFRLQAERDRRLGGVAHECQRLLQIELHGVGVMAQVSDRDVGTQLQVE